MLGQDARQTFVDASLHFTRPSSSLSQDWLWRSGSFAHGIHPSRRHPSLEGRLGVAVGYDVHGTVRTVEYCIPVAHSQSGEIQNR